MRRLSNKQKGAILALWAMLIPVILGFVVLTIDLANLFRWRAVLEKSAKSAIIAGMMFRTQQGWMNMFAGPQANPQRPDDRDFPTIADSAAVPINSAMNDRLKSLMRSISEENIARNIASANELTYVGSPQLGTNGKPLDLRSDTLSMSLSYDVPTIFAGRLSSIGINLGCSAVPEEPSRCRVSTRAAQTVNLRPISILLVLDISGSMACSDAGGKWGCKISLGSGLPISGAPPRIERLRESVLDFTRQFNPFTTRIALIPFGMSARTAVSLDSTVYAARDEFAKTRIQETLVPSGNTNICDGLLQAAEQIRFFQGDSPSFTVLFTDGAPNAMKGSFMQPDGTTLFDKALIAPLSPNGCLLSSDPKNSNVSNDWYMYLAEMSEELSSGTTKLHRVPAELVHVSSRYDLYNFIFETDNATPNTNPDLHCKATRTDIESSVPNPYNNKICGKKPTISKKYDGLSCLSSLGFTLSISDPPRPPPLPGQPPAPPPPPIVRVVADVALPNESDPKSISNAEQIPYYCAIEAADVIRRPGLLSSLGSQIYTIGLGEPAPRNCNDPFQDSLDWNLRKDIFLERLAMDWSNVTRETHDFTEQKDRTVQCGPRANTALHQGYMSTESWPAAIPSNPGMFLGIRSSETLRDAFRNVATQIALGMLGG